MTRRVKASEKQQARLLTANANRCCVCKRGGVGLHLHHINGNPSDTVDQNLAVLCVEDHDRHHRPAAYQSHVQHLELSAEEICSYKTRWESFVSACQRPGSPVLATVTMFGTDEIIHSAQVVYQWQYETIEHKRSFHLLDGGYEQWADELIREITTIGPHLGMAMVSEPQSVEHCPCCGTGFSHTVKPALVIKLTDPRWSTQSVMSIYINPERPSLAIAVGLGEEHLYSASLHVCQGEFLHYMCDYYQERFRLTKKPSIRTQAARMIEKVVDEWNPATLLFGTGDHDTPEIIEQFELPRCWERRTAHHPLDLTR